MDIAAKRPDPSLVICCFGLDGLDPLPGPSCQQNCTGCPLFNICLMQYMRHLPHTHTRSHAPIYREKHKSSFSGIPSAFISSSETKSPSTHKSCSVIRCLILFIAFLMNISCKDQVEEWDEVGKEGSNVGMFWNNTESSVLQKPETDQFDTTTVRA